MPPHLGLVVGSCLGSHAVARQRARVDPKLLGKKAHRARRGVGHVVGAEPQHPQPTQLERPTKTVGATVTSAYFGQIGIAGREEPVEGFASRSGGNSDSRSRCSSDKNRAGTRRPYDSGHRACSIALLSVLLMPLPDGALPPERPPGIVQRSGLPSLTVASCSTSSVRRTWSTTTLSGTSALCREVTEALKALQGQDQGQQVGGRSRQTLGPSDLIRGGG